MCLDEAENAQPLNWMMIMKKAAAAAGGGGKENFVISNPGRSLK